MKHSLRIAIVILLCTSSVLAAGPRWRRGGRGGRFHNRHQQFPVIVDFNGRRSGYRSGTSAWLPHGSATYTSIPAGWGPVAVTAPPAGPPGAGIAPMAPLFAPGYPRLRDQTPLPPQNLEGAMEYDQTIRERDTAQPPSGASERSGNVWEAPDRTTLPSLPADTSGRSSDFRRLGL